jgi:site-specific recombinase XerD
MLRKQNSSNLSDEPHLQRFATRLREQGYAHKTAVRYLAVAKRFLAYLAQRNVALEAATPADVESYLQKELRRFRRLRECLPTALDAWHRKRRAPIHLLLRMVQRAWPPVVPPATPLAIFHQQLLDGCARWLADCRGLAPETIVARRGQWQRFLHWLDERGSQERLRDLSVADLDAYLQFRAQSVRRSTRAELALGLRSFVAYLYQRGLLARDLSHTITGPTMYAFEGIPSALTHEQIALVVAFARKDRTPRGLRTFAIVMLLAQYGLRAGEVVRLRLEDIDWRQGCLRIRHSKTGAETRLPLMPSVGDALLDYLQQARPKTAAREVFVRLPAPHVPLRRGSSLYPLIQRLLGKAGVTLEGKRGPHTFRHARAVSLLRAAVPLKAIGDILGHRSAASTRPYLKLATEDLRAVGLDVPKGVRP